MKKIIIMLLCLLLVGCSTQQPVVEEKPKIIINNEYFSIELPDYWKGHYVFETINDELGYAIVLYEVTSYQSEYGGHMMSISLYTSEEDYSFLPSYDKIGTLSFEQTSYDVLIEYPTDVQFSEETQNDYHELVQDLDEIIESFKATSPYVFTKVSS